MRTLLLALALLLAAAPAYAQKTKSLAADTSGVYELRDVTTPPRALNVADLREALVNTYPAPLRDAAVNGIVQVRFRVDAAGVPHDFVVMESTNAAFDKPTLEAIAKLRFSPARLAGRPVAVWVIQPIHWTVEM
jgi:periplasmic protein TonB